MCLLVLNSRPAEASTDGSTTAWFALASSAVLAALSAYLWLQLRQERRRREAAEQECQNATRANRAKNQFLERLSTAFRTPLNVILGFAQLQKRQLGADASADTVRNTQANLDAGWQVLELLDDIIDIARLEQETLRIKEETCALDDVIAHAVRLVAEDATLAGVDLTAETTSLTVRADYNRLKQVLVSLLRNAVQYNRPGGSVHVDAVRTNDGQVICRVSDTGMGISEEDLPHVFEAFSRLPAGIQARPEGAGTGLALATLLCQVMGGSLDATSSPGEGSTFSVRLRCSEAHAAEMADGETDSAAAPPSKPIKVVYVEDHSASIDLMKAIMEPLDNVNLSTATNAEDGIDMVREQQPDLVLLDINLAGMDGITAARVIRADPAMAPVMLVALSADATEAQISEALEAGFDEYLAKPLDIDKLWELLRQLGQQA